MAYGFIYMTENLVNHKKYIGQRHYDKKGEWKNYLGSGKYLMRAVKKYGRDNFSRTIIDEADSPSELNEKEIYWISYYNAAQDRAFYNVAAGGHQNSLAGYSPEQRDAIRQRQINAVKAASSRRVGENVGNHKLSTQDVKEIIAKLLSGENRHSIARTYNVASQTIQDIALHRTWKHLTDGIVFPTPTIEETHRDSILACRRAVDVYDLCGNYIGTYKSQRAAASALGICYKHIPDVCNGKRKYAEGYVFRYHIAANENALSLTA